MNRRECFNAIVNHQEPERVLVDFGKHIGSFHQMAYEALKEYLKTEVPVAGKTQILDRMAQNVILDEEIYQRLGIDFRWLIPKWVGVRDIEIDGESGYVDMWQTPHKWTDVGNYYAIAAQPLGQGNLTQADLDAFEWPNPDDTAMFAGLREQAQRWHDTTDYVIGADGIKVGILQTASQLRGYDKLFMDFSLNPELAHALLGKISSLINRMYQNYMAAVGDLVQVVCITDDQGTQSSLMVSPEMFREFFKPYLKSQIDTIKQAANVKVLMHCDGAIMPILDDLIEIGVDIINPIQTVVKGFDDTAALKTKFGDRITFHAAIDVQQVMPNTTPDELRVEVARRLQDLGPNGGYILAPCHNINVDIPLENVMAMFDAAREFGGYPLQLANIVGTQATTDATVAETEEIVVKTAGAELSEEQREILEDLAEDIITGSITVAPETVEDAIDAGIEATVILNQGMIAGMTEIGDRFERGDAFVPEMLLAANTMQAGLNILRPKLIEADIPPAGKIVLGTVKGDLHDIGKNLVGMMFEGAGFEVIDLGIDVPPAKFVAAIKEHQPDLVGMSALLTTTMRSLQATVEAIVEAGVRDQVKIMIGGAPVTQEYADKIGVDLYAPDAGAAARRARQAMG
jgi:corrinoid protein of di/trimethylamine methyltransferase